LCPYLRKSKRRFAHANAPDPASCATNVGHIHNRGEHVTILGHWLELGTHRDLLRARWDSGDTAILLPEDVEED